MSGGLTSPKLIAAASTLVQAPVIRAGTPVRPRSKGDLQVLLELVGNSLGIPIESIRSRSKRAEIVHARRVAIVAAYEILGRTLVDITAVVGISSAAGCNLLRRSPELVKRARAEAESVAETYRQIAVATEEE